MRTTLRNREILELLDEIGELSVPEVCTRLSLSPATARRAFARLAAAGLAEKVWGGLMRRNPATVPGNDMVPSSLREKLNAEAKDAIARQAAMLVEDGDVVAIDGGTTTLRLSSYLANRPIRILTNSILIAHRIEQLRNGAKSAEVFLTGGFVYPGSGLLVGPQAVSKSFTFKNGGRGSRRLPLVIAGLLGGRLVSPGIFAKPYFGSRVVWEPLVPARRRVSETRPRLQSHPPLP
jgi:DeoR/GlpR family transcriptional regulator of sugar metabolism